jgi:hypothetical protein
MPKDDLAMIAGSITKGLVASGSADVALVIVVKGDRQGTSYAARGDGQPMADPIRAVGELANLHAAGADPDFARKVREVMKLVRWKVGPKSVN